MIMDSLRYWVTEMHVDGFRFDLASTLARELHDVDRLSSFFDLVQQDPVINQVKLIAEPWDIGEGGYQVGNFPPLWSEWNGKYRDCIRDFWRGQDQTLGEFAYRFTGSSDLYENNARRPFASINFITAHDGFTLNDLVSYNKKHNEANGEENRDGANDNRSFNCGAEGPTDDETVNSLRDRQKRNFLSTLLLSQGVPMLLGGDEFGRTQQGNNNAYCQDNEISWFDWENMDEDLLQFTKDLIDFRWNHPVFTRQKWFQGRSINGSELHDIAWFTPEGHHMTEDNWTERFAKCIMIFLNGKAIPGRDSRGNIIEDSSFLILVNAYHESVDFTLPGAEWAEKWKTVLDTSSGGFSDNGIFLKAGDVISVEGRTFILAEKEEENGS
jgi:glycogen operon protein